MVCTSAFYTVKEVAAILGIAESTAYQVVQKMNKEIEKEGGYYVRGKVNKKIFREKYRLDESDIVFQDNTVKAAN